jgi:energy-coupling factor transport system ATP-binding protein
MIALKHVCYTYPGETTAALDDVTLEIPAGEICALAGANGAGKSTLCYAIAGFVPHYYHGELRGEIIVDGRWTVEHPLGELVKHCGLVFHNPLNQISGARFTVREELAFGLENLGVSRAEMRARIDTVLAHVGILDLADRSPFELSGGQQQRVALASILVMGPRVLVLDEPTSQLDPLGTKEVFAAIKTLSRSGVTIVLAEHKPELIAEFADRVVVLHQGRIWMQGAPREVLGHPGLQEIGVSVSRYSLAAQAARDRGLWSLDQPLPVTLKDAVTALRGDAAQPVESLPANASGRGQL